MADDKLVLVTGGTGFIALHVIHQLLERGYRVRTTLRSLKRSDEVRSAIRRAGVAESTVAGIAFAEANLLDDAGWDAACAGADYVLHVASPFPAAEPRHADELIRPAREGTLRVLRAARRAGTVLRVVVTSSIVAVAWGHGPRSAACTEADWTQLSNPRSPVGAYVRSKTLAERAAWAWLAAEGAAAGAPELTTVNPALVLGPSLAGVGGGVGGGDSSSTSLGVPGRLLSGALPAIPDMSFSVVDVRDAAALHVLAMEAAGAAGQRYIASSDEPCVTMRQMAADLKRLLPAADTRRVPSLPAPTVLLRVGAWFDRGIAVVLPDVGRARPVSNRKAREELGWRPRSAAEALVASAESLKANGQLCSGWSGWLCGWTRLLNGGSVLVGSRLVLVAVLCRFVYWLARIRMRWQRKRR